MDRPYSRKLGSFLIILAGGLHTPFIAEVIQEEPLRVKIQESGPFSNLREESFQILELETKFFQNEETRDKLLQKHKDADLPILCSLKAFEIEDNVFYGMVPDEEQPPDTSRLN